jgi:hypothetical protein
MVVLIQSTGFINAYMNFIIPLHQNLSAVLQGNTEVIEVQDIVK